MKQCPITYELHSDESIYSKKGLRYISSGLSDILPVVESQFNALKNRRSQHILPALLSPTTSRFVPAGEKHPSYYLFTGSPTFSSLPENMDVSLRVAALFGLPVSLHGLVLSDRNSRLLFVKNPAAYSKNRFHPMHSVRTLAGIGHQAFIDLEQVAEVIEKNTSFPLIEKIKLLKLAVVVFLSGDTHFGPDQLTILDENGKKTLSPVNEFANMAMYNGEPEMHLRLNGKSGLWTMDDLLQYFGKKTLGIPAKTVDQVAIQFKSVIRPVFSLLENCFLPDDLKEEYLLTIDNRWSELGF